MYKIIDGWMVFDEWFNKPLSNVFFPTGIRKVILGYCFRQDISNSSTLPNSLTHLTFCRYFNKDVSNLPNSLTHLTFGWRFNQDVSKLPNSLTHLTFGDDFNQDVSQLPKSITYLKFYIWGNSKFNQSLNPYLYHLTSFDIKNSHKHKRLMVERCQINKHNRGRREDKLIDLLLKIE